MWGVLEALTAEGVSAPPGETARFRGISSSWSQIAPGVEGSGGRQWSDVAKAGEVAATNKETPVQLDGSLGDFGWGVGVRKSFPRRDDHGC